MKKKVSLILCGLALLLTVAASLRGAQAYFTANAWAKGGKPIHLGYEERIREEFSSWTKHVTITAEPDSEPVFVRARAYADETVNLTVQDEAGNWTLNEEDGWWYYGPILRAEEATGELLVKITDLPKDAEPGTDFNVIIVYECTRVLYQADGTPYADWSKAERGETP